MESSKEQGEVITSYKGFNSDWTCRGFQYEIGKTYTHEGVVKACEGGFHACEHPLDVFNYYPPAGSKFAEVEQSGDLSREDGDSKVASRSISVKAELTIAGLVKAAIEYTTKRCTPVDPASPASATGDWGAASATGYQGAAMASGREGRAMGKEGCALFLVERDSAWKIVAAWAGIVGQDGIKPDTWYTLENGKPVEAQE